MCKGSDRIKCAKGLRCLMLPMPILVPILVLNANAHSQKMGICVKRDGPGSSCVCIKQNTSSYPL